MVIYSVGLKSRQHRGVTQPLGIGECEGVKAVNYTSPASSTIDLIMDVERYYAAFPALEKSVPAYIKLSSTQLKSLTEGQGDTKAAAMTSSTSHDKHDSSVERKRAVNGKHGRSSNYPKPKAKPSSSVTPRTQQHSHFNHSNHGKSSPSPSNRRVHSERVRSSQQATNGHRQQQQQQVTNGREKHANNGKASSPAKRNTTRAIRFESARDGNKIKYDKKKGRQLQKSLDGKPWKNLLDLEVYEPLAVPAKQADEAAWEEKQPWLDLDEHQLDALLRSDSDGSTPDATGFADLTHFWSASPSACLSNDLESSESADLASGWPKSAAPVCCDMGASEGSAAAAVAAVPADSSVDGAVGGADEDPAAVDDDLISAAHRSWLIDYRSIEEQMNGLSVTDSADESNGSKLMHHFRENPLSYMIQNGRYSSAEDNELEDYTFNFFSCEHCEETYEIVLESELEQASKMLPKTKLFSHVDPRLNFDWTKYHPPPPWVPLPNRMDTNTNFNCRDKYVTNCDCEYCRSRIWRRVCTRCGTPC